MTKIEIIEETVKFYSDTNKRSVSDTGNCLYKHPNGNECAFQRCVETDLSLREGVGAALISDYIPNIKFKPGYEGHDFQFWSDIQILHDCKSYWDENALTNDGIEFVNSLKVKYGTNNDDHVEKSNSV